jgi:hypothetical protein
MTTRLCVLTFHFILTSFCMLFVALALKTLVFHFVCSVGCVHRFMEKESSAKQVSILL